MINYDIAVIGAGHAGCEAAIAAAKIGCHSPTPLTIAVFTLSCDIIANMPCNPSIGGSAKGQIVREIDALGGVMGKAADETGLLFRVLGQSKGAAVRALRVQSDRAMYHLYMKSELENTDNLYIIQNEVTGITRNSENDGFILYTNIKQQYNVRKVIIAAGTYLNSLIHIGETSYNSAADGMHSANFLTQSLTQLGVQTRRFKTGTPARVHKRSIDFDILEKQYGDTDCEKFAFDDDRYAENKICCHITHTNAITHDIIRENLHRSPLYAGRIEGVGPRYCPSIEDKVVRFADKERHQLFIEPCGLRTTEYYLQGMSSSLPLDVQYAFLRTIKGLENVEVIRPAYAIEYDCADPLQLYPRLEFKGVSGLFGAGQFIGTSGYEEAAGLGLLAGINAALTALGKSPLILPRVSSYIGTLADDLSLKGTAEPYRMLTARSEYRLLIRSDNATDRLSGIGREIGLLPDSRYMYYTMQRARIDAEKARLLREKTDGKSLHELLKRPENTYNNLHCGDLTKKDALKCEIEIKYEPYEILARKQAAKTENSLDKIKIPPDTDYTQIRGLRTEAIQKLAKVKPLDIASAARISGVNPADITVLIVWVKKRNSN
ncbi:MAG: tRNA uridine-5-carboxymethylaminomethyl(34) synthesis enzyme MnmG [Oscillospiraceae bacterium]|jgi:tRNA uridine 5-carboxymethylaminomethyl modification enzyme|nr:tRNA uridine-5-carboxymethylaminomethyl(34) synthesis enzyme MnmG [Oscillospiraceae bacterium]